MEFGPYFASCDAASLLVNPSDEGAEETPSVGASGCAAVAPTAGVSGAAIDSWDETATQQNSPQQNRGLPPTGAPDLSPSAPDPSSVPGAKSAHEEDDEAHQQYEAHPASANDGTSEIEAAAAEQEKKHNHQ
jgi:hypothetical protein